MTGRRRERGYSLVTLMVAVAVMLIMMTAAVPSWRYVMKNDREEELIFRGGEIADAIARYQRKNGNALPPSLEVLVKGKFLRRAYKDPMTKDGKWRFIRPGEPMGPMAPGAAGTVGAGSTGSGTGSGTGSAARTRGLDRVRLAHGQRVRQQRELRLGVRHLGLERVGLRQLARPGRVGGRQRLRLDLLSAGPDDGRLPGRREHEHGEEPARVQRPHALQRVALPPRPAARRRPARGPGRAAAGRRRASARRDVGTGTGSTQP